MMMTIIIITITFVILVMISLITSKVPRIIPAAVTEPRSFNKLVMFKENGPC